MITFNTGDILAEDVEAQVNAVDCVGEMGSGLTLQFKREFPNDDKAVRRPVCVPRSNLDGCSSSKRAS